MTDRLVNIFHFSHALFLKIESKAVHELNQLFLFFVVKSLSGLGHRKKRKMLNLFAKQLDVCLLLILTI